MSLARRSCRPSTTGVLSREPTCERVYVRCYRDKQAFEEAFLNIFGLPAGRVVAYYIRGPDLYLRNGTCTNVRAFLERAAHGVHGRGLRDPPARSPPSTARRERAHHHLLRERGGSLGRPSTRFQRSAGATCAKPRADLFTRSSRLPDTSWALRHAAPWQSGASGPTTEEAMADAEQAQERVEQQEQEESLKQRLEREHGELIQELRALIPERKSSSDSSSRSVSRASSPTSRTPSATSTTSPCCPRRLRSSSSSRPPRITESGFARATRNT